MPPVAPCRSCGRSDDWDFAQSQGDVNRRRVSGAAGGRSPCSPSSSVARSAVSSSSSAAPAFAAKPTAALRVVPSASDNASANARRTTAGTPTCAPMPAIGSARGAPDSETPRTSRAQLHPPSTTWTSSLRPSSPRRTPRRTRARPPWRHAMTLRPRRRGLPRRHSPTAPDAALHCLGARRGSTSRTEERDRALHPERRRRVHCARRRAEGAVR